MTKDQTSDVAHPVSGLLNLMGGLALTVGAGLLTVMMFGEAMVSSTPADRDRSDLLQRLNSHHGEKSRDWLLASKPLGIASAHSLMVTTAQSDTKAWIPSPLGVHQSIKDTAAIAQTVEGYLIKVNSPIEPIDPIEPTAPKHDPIAEDPTEALSPAPQAPLPSGHPVIDQRLLSYRSASQVNSQGLISAITNRLSSVENLPDRSGNLPFSERAVEFEILNPPTGLDEVEICFTDC